MNKKIRKLVKWFTGAEKYYSSAQLLSHVLKRKNIKLDNKIFCKYVLPDNQTPAKYAKKIQLAHLFFLYEHGDLNKWIREGWLEHMSDKDIKKIEEYIYAQKETSKNVIDNDTKIIRKLNPMLSTIHMRSKFDKIAFLDGVTYGFAPAEIGYFVYRNSQPISPEEDIKRMESFGKKLGYKVGYILAPETQAEIESKLE
jgi:hypothetical protein